MRSTHRWGLVLLALAAFGLGACGDEGPLQGARSACSYAGGSGLDCNTVPIETPEDACWKLVGCGAIPLDEPDPDRNWVLDWARCVRTVENLQSFQETLALRCVEVASCDQLKNENSPTQPSGGEQSLPLCLQYGDQ